MSTSHSDLNFTQNKVFCQEDVGVWKQNSAMSKANFVLVKANHDHKRRYSSTAVQAYLEKII